MTAQSGTIPSPEQSVQIVEQFLAAVQRRDLIAVSALLADQAALIQPFTFSGLSERESMFSFPHKEAVLSYFQSVFQNFSQIAFLEREVSVTHDGRTVFVETLGDLCTAATNTLYSNRYVFKFDLDQDRIIYAREYANPVTASPILGIPLGLPDRHS